MKFILLGLLAETPIHPGSGRSAGFVDLPVAREAATDYPVVVGASVKGALLDLAAVYFRSLGLSDVADEEQEMRMLDTALLFGYLFKVQLAGWRQSGTGKTWGRSTSR